MESLLLLHGVISLQDGTSYHLINAISSGLTLFAKIKKDFGYRTKSSIQNDGGMAENSIRTKMVELGFQLI